jgi:SAM-dependent methyltransferase
VSELLIGCGHRRDRILGTKDNQGWTKLTTLDHNPDCKPDIVHDLNVLPYPLEDNSFDEIHAYEVLEHCGRQGDAEYYFAQWNEFYRILKPSGLFFATVPDRNSVWAWGDPSHTRIIQEQSLWFLNQDFYKQLGQSASSDFRRVYRGNFSLNYSEVNGNNYFFVLKAIK